ncbi:MAG: hypothetical protein KKD90_06245 [Candidatus Omnitrophica bacterium]|nr:hypothetical protein [Candidatus Omnitrophota bacterium]
MLKQITLLLICGFLLLAGTEAHAEYKKVKVIGQVETKFIRTATTGQQKLALEDARKKALDKYIAELDSQRVRILNNVIDQLRQNLATYVPEVVALDDGNWNNGYWTIGVQASINEAQIEELVNKYTQANIKKKEEVYLSFVFLAREVESVKAFMDEKAEKTVESNDYKENLGIDEKANVTTDEKIGVATDEKLDQSQKKRPGIVSKGSSEEVKYQGESTAKYQGNLSDEQSNVYEKTTSGSVEKKSEVVKYRSYTSEEIEAKVTEVFNKADFTVVPTFEAGIDKDKFIKDFSAGNDISDSTKKETVDLTKDKGISLLAIAMLDVGRDQIDQATGLSKVYVNVMGYILDSRGKFTKKIASVGPIQYSGIGENPKVAKVNALVSASTSAAKDLIDQLRAKEGL